MNTHVSTGSQLETFDFFKRQGRQHSYPNCVLPDWAVLFLLNVTVFL